MRATVAVMGCVSRMFPSFLGSHQSNPIYFLSGRRWLKVLSSCFPLLTAFISEWTLLLRYPWATVESVRASSDGEGPVHVALQRYRLVMSVMSKFSRRSLVLIALCCVGIYLYSV